MELRHLKATEGLQQEITMIKFVVGKHQSAVWGQISEQQYQKHGNQLAPHAAQTDSGSTGILK